MAAAIKAKLEEELEEKRSKLDADTILEKYKVAGDIASRALKLVADAAIEGATVVSLCKLGDDFILAETQKVYTKKVDGKSIERGVAFPTSVSLNEMICNNSPLLSDPVVTLKKGDLVKIDLGAHIDGFIGVVATTLVVGASEAAPVTGRQADVIMAAHDCVEAVLRAIQPGVKSTDISTLISDVAAAYKCTPVEGMLSHELTKNVINGEQSIIQNPNEAQRKEVKSFTFAPNQVYAIDIIISSGEGKPKQSEARTTVYKKTNAFYQLKLKTSREFMTEVNKKFSDMPFTLRACEDEKKARLGVTECVSHGVLEPFGIFLDKKGEFVAQFKTVILLHPRGPLRLTNDTLAAGVVKSELSIQTEAIKDILARPLTTSVPKAPKAPKPATDAPAPAETK